MANPTMAEMLKSAKSIDDKLLVQRQDQALAAAKFKVEQLTPTKAKRKARA